MISICSQQCNYSMKRQRFFCFTSFAQNADIHMSGTGETLRLTQNGKTIICTMDISELLVVSRLSSYSSSRLSTTSRWTDQPNYSRKLGSSSDPVQTRSDKHACGKPMLTDHDKQATGNREPANEMVSQNSDPKKSVLRKAGQTRLNASPRHAVKFSGRTWCEVQLRDRKGPSRGVIQKGEPHVGNPCAPKFEERTLEETSRQEEYARKAAWNLAWKMYKLMAEDKATFYSLVKIKAPVLVSKNT